MNYIEYLEKNLDILQENLKKDDAGYASTMLHRFRRRLEELNSIRYFLVEQNKIYDIDGIDDQIKEIRKIIHERLEKRISWQAGLIDQTIANRKAKGTYKGEFTTATILANAYNDIFQAIDETFNGEYGVGYSDVPHSVENIHRICDTCMMPIEVKNPWNEKD